MNILVCTAVSQNYDNNCFRLFDTAAMFNIPITKFGTSKKYINWTDIKINQFIEFLKPLNYDIVLYTDGGDSWFLSNLDEIISKFVDMNSPVVIAAEKDCYPLSDLYSLFPETKSKYRYINAGGFIGYFDKVLSQLETIQHHYTHTNDQAMWTKAYVDNKLDLRIDSNCEIFQCTGGDSWETELNWENGRVHNLNTNSFPCILHCNGSKKHMPEIYEQFLRERKS